MATIEDLTLDISQSIQVNAAAQAVFANLIQRLTVNSTTADNTPMPLTLEEWPGGRWFRDLGDQQGHLWGFVQVIKPPRLLEICGPMFMSYPAAGHIQFRITESDAGCELSLRHQALGFIQDNHREGVVQGWGNILKDVKAGSE